MKGSLPKLLTSLMALSLFLQTSGAPCDISLKDCGGDWNVAFSKASSLCNFAQIVVDVQPKKEASLVGISGSTLTLIGSGVSVVLRLNLTHFSSVTFQNIVSEPTSMIVVDSPSVVVEGGSYHSGTKDKVLFLLTAKVASLSLVSDVQWTKDNQVDNLFWFTVSSSNLTSLTITNSFGLALHFLEQNWNGNLPKILKKLSKLDLSSNQMPLPFPQEIRSYPLSSLKISGNAFTGDSVGALNFPSLISCDASLAFQCPILETQVSPSCRDTLSCPIDSSRGQFQVKMGPQDKDYNGDTLTSAISAIASVPSERLQMNSITASNPVVVVYTVTEASSYYVESSNAMIQRIVSIGADPYSSFSLNVLSISSQIDPPAESTSPPAKSSPVMDLFNKYKLFVILGGVLLLLIVIIVPILVILIKRRRARGGYKKVDQPPRRPPVELKEDPRDLNRYSAVPAQDLRAGYIIPKTELGYETSEHKGQLTLLSQIGEGAFGVVWKGQYEHSSEFVAVKQLKPEALSLPTLQDFLAEAELMRGLKHKNVVGFITLSSHPLALVTEYMNGGDLATQLKLNTLTFGHRLRILREIAEGMAYLVSRNLIHKDLACRNILLDDNLTAKVSDFGLSRIVSQHRGDHMSKSEIGPVKWMAPESLLKKVYSEKSDVWSWGVVCIEVLTGYEPFPEYCASDFAIKVISEHLHDQYITMVPHTSPKLYALLESVFSIEPAYRPTFEKIVSSEF